MERKTARTVRDLSQSAAFLRREGADETARKIEQVIRDIVAAEQEVEFDLSIPDDFDGTHDNVPCIRVTGVR